MKLDLPRWLRFTLLAELALPGILALVATGEFLGLLVPLAGPFAARLYGHSCGLDAHAPWLTLGLVVLGLVSGAVVLRLRKIWAWLPLALLWWPAWLLAALVSAANAHE